MGPKRGPATASDELCCLTRRQMMEPLWSLVVATSGNRSQIRRPKEPQKHAKTVAVGCHRLLFGAHGKEGVDGSSLSEGSAKAPLPRMCSVGAGPARPRYGAVYGAFASRTP